LKLSRNVVALLAFNTLRGATVGGFIALLPIYMASLGYGMDLIGGAIAASSIILSFLLPGIGYAIDRLGSRVIIIITGLLLAAAPLIPAYTTSLGLLAVSYGLMLASFFMGQPARMTFLARSVDNSSLGTYIGLVSGAMSASRLVGPALAGFLAESYGYRESFIVLFSLAAAGLAAFAAISVSPGDRVAKGGSRLLEVYRRALRPERGYALVLGFLAMDRFSWSLWFPLLSAYLYKLGFDESEVGLLMSFSGLTRTISLPVFGRIIDRTGAWLGIAVSEALGLVSVSMLAYATGSMPVVVAVGAMGVSIALWIPSYNTLIARVAGKRLGEAYAVANSIRSLAGSPAPYVGGLLYESLAPTAPFILSAFIMASAAVFAVAKLGPVEASVRRRMLDEAPLR